MYRYDFIVAARRGNNIFAVLSSSRSAGMILLPFYRHRAAREQYFCHFIVVAQRGNNICAVLSSPLGAETIFVPVYRRRAARERYFCVLELAALLQALKFLFPPLLNGDVCWNGRGGCLCARLNVFAAAFPCQKHMHGARRIERRIRPYRATRAGTQAPPLPISTKPRGVPPTALHCTFDSSKPHGVFISHRIVHSIAHANRTVCHYPIGVILSIAQGWQVQRSLPWVTMQARSLPPWGLYSFSSHIITTRGE